MTLKKILTKAICHPGYTMSRVQGRLDSLVDDLFFSNFKVSSDEVVNDKEIRVFGLKRSGNHGIINWIEKQEIDALHLNDLRIDENPYKCIYKGLSGQGHPQEQWMAEQTTNRYRQYQGEEGKKLLGLESQGHFQKKKCLILSYEDYPLARVASPNIERKHDLYVGKSAERFDVLILRDPYNLIASRLRSNKAQVKSITQNIVDIWIDYAKEFLGETNYLSQTKVFINYNKWFSDKDTRKLIAQQLKLNFSDLGINDIPKFGGGSSFSKTEFDGRAVEMDPLSRWKYYADNKEYQNLLNNGELIHYSQKIFGYIPDTEILRS